MLHFIWLCTPSYISFYQKNWESKGGREKERGRGKGKGKGEGEMQTQHYTHSVLGILLNAL